MSSWIVSACGLGFRAFTYVLDRVGLRCRLKVSLHEGDRDVRGGPIRLVLRVANPGPKIKVVGVLLRLPKVKNAEPFRFTSFSSELPFFLESEDNFAAWMNAAELVNDLRPRGLRGTVKVQGIVSDSLDRSYRSNRLKLNLDKSFFPIVERGD